VIDRAVSKLFRAGVGEGGPAVVALFEFFLRGRDAEVADVRGAAGVEQDVRGLDVAVDDPLPVAVVEDAGHLGEELHRVGDRQRPASEPFGEVFALDKVADDDVTGPFLQHVMHGDDAGMAQPRDPAGLGEQLIDLLISQPPRCLRNFYGDGALKLLIGREPDLSVSAFADESLQSIPPGEDARSGGPVRLHPVAGLQRRDTPEG